MKRLLFCFSSLVSLIISGQVNLDSGLVACYPLDGHVVDLVSGINGTLPSVLSGTDKNQNLNSTIDFPITGTGYVKLPGNTQLKDNAVSFSAWIYPKYTSSSSSYIVFTKTSAVSAQPAAAYALVLETIGGGKKIKVIKNTSTQTFTLANGTNVFNNLWHHVCFTMDSLQMTVYLNGVLAGTLSAPGNIAYQTGKDVYLGSSTETPGSNPFYGAIDNARFYNRVLSPLEVLSLYQNDPVCTTATLAPISSFSMFANCARNTVQLTSTSANYPSSWSWTVSGVTLTNASSPSPIFTVNSPGPFTVTLVTSNSLGVDTLVQTIQLSPIPVISVVPSRTFICRNEVYILTAHNNAMPTFTWNGSIVSPTISASHNLVGTYTQSVAGIDTMGCFVDTVFYVKVNSCNPAYNSIEEEYINIATDIFPNPTGRFITVNKPAGVYRYFVFDISGAKVLSGEMKEEPSSVIDLGELAAGVYFLEIKNGSKTYVRKIVKSD